MLQVHYSKCSIQVLYVPSLVVCLFLSAIRSLDRKHSCLTLDINARITKVDFLLSSMNVAEGI